MGDIVSLFSEKHGITLVRLEIIYNHGLAGIE